MNNIKTFNEYLFESNEINKYSDYERGIIKAWGHVLYLGYHHLPNKLRIVSEKMFKETFLDYYKNSDNDEDFQEWMADGPPTINGVALFDKNKLKGEFVKMSNKTKLKKDLLVYRSSYDNNYVGWNSFTTNEKTNYGNNKNTYKLPKGFPVIFTNGLADYDEVILNLSKSEEKKYKIE